MASDFQGEIHSLQLLTATATPSLSTAGRARLSEAIFVKAFTEFESFLEELFFAIVTGATRLDGATPRLRIRNAALARDLATGEARSGYLSWLPLGDTMRRAERFLVDGEPFARLDRRSTIRNDLDRAQKVRNATAHKSADAHAKFQRAVNGSYATSGDYLISRSGSKSTCESILDDLHRYADALVEPQARSDALLGPEDPLRSGMRKHGGGAFECLNCGTRYTVMPSEALQCPTCDPPCSACGKRSVFAAFRRL